MKGVLRYTLVSDGSSDRALIPIITWALRQQVVTMAIQPEWADLSRLPRRPKTLAERIKSAISLYPCELLCVHRDAEREHPANRRDEIESAIRDAVADGVQLPPALCVIPVRMQEAWLLFDEAAIRAAAGNPNGRMPLELPAATRIERLPNPKETLRGLLRQASGLSGRRLGQLDDRPHRVVSFIDDFTSLRHLSAFQELEAELHTIVVDQGWAQSDGDATVVIKP